MVSGSSLRRRIFCLQLGVNRKLTVIRWMGQFTVWVKVKSVRLNSNHDPVKAGEGAEKSSRRARGSRGDQRSGGRAREGKSRCSPKLRLTPTPAGRKTKRSAREVSWMLRSSEKLASASRDLRGGPSDWKKSSLCLSYGSLSGQVAKMGAFTAPIGFVQFVRQSKSDIPWNSEPDVCLRMSVLPDLEYSLRGRILF